MRNMSFEQCMDVFDWFDDPMYEYLYHTWVAKMDGEERIGRAMPSIAEHAHTLIEAHAGTESAYPMELLNQPA